MKLLLAFLFLISFHANCFSQAGEPQPYPLYEYKITFNEVQFESESLQILTSDNEEISGVQPIILKDELNQKFTIDFSACEEGEYLIKGRRGSIDLTYIISR
ncbi:hypothetical protein [Crocinitomix algicola]|uniref:hypothetical protein n=1 Tax=Crocinitomix algicola TaxID=1740263 RepID=UPI00083720D2|nr:hypothetical protein [Crocinitomix algicola]